MNGTERVKALLNNEKPDRILTATWMHVPDVDKKPELFAPKIIELTEAYDADIVKIQMDATYIAESYGQDMTFYEHPSVENQRIKKLFEVNKYLIRNLDDVKNIKLKDASTDPVIQREAKGIKLIADHYKGTKPVLPTLFSSFSWLVSMTEGRIDKVREFIKEDRAAVDAALEIINEYNIAIVDEFIKAGADGFFFATSFTSPNAVTREEFEEFNKKYDLEVLNHIHENTWFNMLHVHGNADLYIEDLVKYPVESINWENNTWGVDPSKLTTAKQLRALTDKILIGGNDQFHDFYGSLEEVEEHFTKNLQTFIDEIPDGKFIFGAGCSIPLDVKPEKLKLVRKVADKLQK